MDLPEVLTKDNFYLLDNGIIHAVSDIYALEPIPRNLQLTRLHAELLEYAKQVLQDLKVSHWEQKIEDIHKDSQKIPNQFDQKINDILEIRLLLKDLLIDHTAIPLPTAADLVKQLEEAKAEQVSQVQVPNLPDLPVSTQKLIQFLIQVKRYTPAAAELLSADLAYQAETNPKFIEHFSTVVLDNTTPLPGTRQTPAEQLLESLMPILKDSSNAHDLFSIGPTSTKHQAELSAIDLTGLGKSHPELVDHVFSQVVLDQENTSTATVNLSSQDISKIVDIRSRTQLPSEIIAQTAQVIQATGVNPIEATQIAADLTRYITNFSQPQDTNISIPISTQPTITIGSTAAVAAVTAQAQLEKIAVTVANQVSTATSRVIIEKGSSATPADFQAAYTTAGVKSDQAAHLAATAHQTFTSTLTSAPMFTTVSAGTAAVLDQTSVKGADKVQLAQAVSAFTVSHPTATQDQIVTYARENLNLSSKDAQAVGATAYTLASTSSPVFIGSTATVAAVVTQAQSDKLSVPVTSQVSVATNQVITQKGPSATRSDFQAAFVGVGVQTEQATKLAATAHQTFTVTNYAASHPTATQDQIVTYARENLNLSSKDAQAVGATAYTLASTSSPKIAIYIPITQSQARQFTQIYAQAESPLQAEKQLTEHIQSTFKISASEAQSAAKQYVQSFSQAKKSTDLVQVAMAVPAVFTSTTPANNLTTTQTEFAIRQYFTTSTTSSAFTETRQVLTGQKVYTSEEKIAIILKNNGVDPNLTPQLTKSLIEFNALSSNLIDKSPAAQNILFREHLTAALLANQTPQNTSATNLTLQNLDRLPDSRIEHLRNASTNFVSGQPELAKSASFALLVQNYSQLSPTTQQAVSSLLQNKSLQQTQLQNVLGSEYLTKSFTANNLHLATLALAQGAASKTNQPLAAHLLDSMQSSLDYMKSITKDPIKLQKIESFRQQLPSLIPEIQDTLLAIQKSPGMSPAAGFVQNGKITGYFKYLLNPKNLAKNVLSNTVKSAFSDDGFIARFIPAPVRKPVMSALKYYVGKTVITSALGQKLGLDVFAAKMGLQFPSKFRALGIFSKFDLRHPIRSTKLVLRAARFNLHISPTTAAGKELLEKIATSGIGKAVGSFAAKTGLKTVIANTIAALGSIAPVIGNIIGFIIGLIVGNLIFKVADSIWKKFGAPLTDAAKGAFAAGLMSVGRTPQIIGGTMAAIGAAILAVTTVIIASLVTPILIAVIGVPIAVAFFLFIITTGAYVIPPSYLTYNFQDGGFEPPLGPNTYAVGTCPVPQGKTGCGSYNSPTARNCHGRNSYWGSNLCRYGVPLDSSSSLNGGRCKYVKTGTPGYEGSSCSRTDSTCTTYGYAADVPPSGSTVISRSVYLPKLADNNGNVISREWTRVTSLFTIFGGAWGHGVFYKTTDNSPDKPVYEIYFGHLAANSPVPLTAKSEDLIGPLFVGTGFSTHLHIELKIQGQDAMPDALCQGV